MQRPQRKGLPFPGPELTECAAPDRVPWSNSSRLRLDKGSSIPSRDMHRNKLSGPVCVAGVWLNSYAKTIVAGSAIMARLYTGPTGFAGDEMSALDSVL